MRNRFKNELSKSRAEFVVAFYAICSVLLFAVVKISENYFDYLDANTRFSLAVGAFFFISSLLLNLLKLAHKRDIKLNEAAISIASLLELARHREKSIHRAGRLMGALEQSGVQEEMFTKICERASGLKFEENSLWQLVAQPEAQSRLYTLHSFLGDIGSRRMQIANDGTLELKKLTRNARSQIRATSISLIDEPFWESPQGLSYIRLMDETLKSKSGIGFQIKRIFIIDRKLTASVAKSINVQLEAGVQVRIQQKARIENGDLVDFVLIDSEILFKIGFTPDGGQTPSSEIIASGSQFKEHEALFDRLWSNAQLPTDSEYNTILNNNKTVHNEIG